MSDWKKKMKKKLKKEVKRREDAERMVLSLVNSLRSFTDCYEALEETYEERLANANTDVDEEPLIIESVTHEGYTTTVTWNDGIVISATCSQKDTYDPEVGFAMCLAKRQADGSNIRRLYQKYTKGSPS